MRRLLFIGCLGYVLAFVTVWTLRHHLIYPFNPAEVAPKSVGLQEMKAQIFPSFDGTNLVLWAQKPKSGKPTVLYFHGNAGNLANRAERFSRMVDRGFGVVAMAYRGSSGSQGRPDEELITKDAYYLRTKLSEILGRDNADYLIYYGESLGTGVAIKLAIKSPPKGVILEAPYTSVTERAAEQMPIFPVRLTLDQRWDNLHNVTQLKTPLLVIHGDQDRVIPFSDGRAVFEAATTANKTFKRMRSKGHTNLWSVEGQRAIYEFIASVK